MLFNSIEYFIFLFIAYILYWHVTNKNLKAQNILLLVLSYIFYGWWKWEFLSLIILSTIVDYFTGLNMHKSKGGKKTALLIVSLTVNIGLLLYFKYANFFIDSFASMLNSVGLNANISSLSIILPVGISFYTFQTLSYSIDIYRGKLEPTKDFIKFAAYVSFFPQLVAGPIERATNLLPQFSKNRVFNYNLSIDGLRQILWGLFQKVVIADNCALIVNEYFNNYGEYSGLTLILGAFFFSFQIYGDFCGYSNIAIGTGKLLGFKLMDNFAYPYFSRDIGGKSMAIRNIFVIFIVSGFWHGANWTFIFWGALNAVYFLPSFLMGSNRKNLTFKELPLIPSFTTIRKIATTFILSMIAWIFFRSDSLTDSFSYIYRIFNFEDAFYIGLNGEFSIYFVYTTFIWIVLLLIIEWLGKEKSHPINNLQVFIPSQILRWCFYFLIGLFVYYYLGNEQEFIYFQF